MCGHWPVGRMKQNNKYSPIRVETIENDATEKWICRDIAQYPKVLYILIVFVLCLST